MVLSKHDKFEEDSGEEALWILPGREDPESGDIPTISPWRTPAALRQNRDVRVKAHLKAVRGPSLCGVVDVKVLAWVSSHVAVPMLLSYIDEDVRRIMAVALGWPWPPADGTASSISGSGSGSGGGSERLQAVVLLVLMAAAVCLYGRLYASDPGWIHAASPAVDSDIEPRRPQKPHPHPHPHPAAPPPPPPPRPPCPHCGESPSLRSHHDKHTGQCVHKHDHHCWLLSATIGDLNHRRFLGLLVVEGALLTWLQLRALPLALSCTATLAAAAAAGLRGAAPPSPSPGTDGAGGDAPLFCSRVPSWGRLVALWAVLAFGVACLLLALQLLGLHLYLAATNQTTLELLKGPRLPYLEDAYASGQCGGGGSRCGGGGGGGGASAVPASSSLLGSRGEVSLAKVVRHHWRGSAPPRPFDEGLWRNLWTFFLAPKPHPYRHR